MDNIIKQRDIFKNNQKDGGSNMAWGMMGKRKRKRRGRAQDYREDSLAAGNLNREYTVKTIETNNSEIKDFLFTLGCYEGEKITIISILGNQYVVVLNNARYSIDNDLAKCIIIE